MKKILFVIDSLNCGGAEKSLLSLLSLLNKEKYHIHIWILHKGGVLEKLLPKHIIQIKESHYSFLDKLLWLKCQIIFSFMIRIKRLFGKKEHGAETLWKTNNKAFKSTLNIYDVAIAYQQGLPTYLVANKIKARKKIAWINTNLCDAGYNIEFNLPFYQLLDKIIMVSDDLKSIMCKHYPLFNNKSLCIYDIINPSLIKDMAAEPINDIIIDNSSVLLLTVGRLVSIKGYDLLIEAARILKKKNFPFRWYIIGIGNEEVNIRKQIIEYDLNKQVILLGLKTNPYPYMRQCDIYVQTSRFEGFGLTIAEAKILQKPIISTNFDVVYNQITPNTNGIITEMNGKSIAKSIIELNNNRQMRQLFISNLKKEQNTTSITEIEKIEQLLDT